MADAKDIFKEILEDSVRKIAPDAAGEDVHVERPKNPDHGDLSTNIALQLSKQLKLKPRDVAEKLRTVSTAALVSRGITTAAGVSIAGPGFLNIKVNPAFKVRSIEQALREQRNFGRGRSAKPLKIQVEFVSANPTGPLHVGHGRQAALGDAIARLLEGQGHAVTREYYYNDAGAQIDKLARSVQARAKGIQPGDPGWPEEGYAGEYIEDIAKEIKNAEVLEGMRRQAVAYLRKEKAADLPTSGVKFDVYVLQSAMYMD